MDPKVAIIILNWNGKEDTIECLESLKHITYLNYEILLVDNGSTDGSVECLRERYPEMVIIENEKNLGFAEGNNVGIRRAMEKNVDYVLLLNNDTVVDSEFLGELVLNMRSDLKIGFVGPKVYYYDYNGRKDVLNFAGGGINLWKGKTYHIGLNEADIGQYDEAREVDYVEGSCVLVRTYMLKKIGLLNSAYFTYWEENEWCMRGHRVGYKAFFAPKAKIWHKIGASNVGTTKQYYMARNMFWFMKEYTSKTQYILFLLYFFGYKMWIKCGVHLHQKNMKAVLAFLSGIKDGL